jgi:SAM-dependent methyltransferase
MTTAPPNLAQDPAAFWNGPMGEKWVRMQAMLDAAVGPLGDAAMDAARIAPGERVLDLGCGCGTTTFELARRVGPEGRVLGLDVSLPMITAARERLGAGAALPQADFLHADASTADLPPAAFHLLFSRLGWMFFPDPVAAFAHLRRSLLPGGRLALVTFRTLAENEWARVPLEAVLPLTGPVVAPPPGTPGPFAFADPDRIRTVLGAAGFADLTVTAFDTLVPIGADLDEAVGYATNFGPSARALADAGISPDQARTALVAALEPHLVPTGHVELRSAAWIVQGRSVSAGS